MNLTEKTLELSESLGIDIIGFAEAGEFKDYLLRDSKRKNPKLSLRDARSFIIFGIYIGGVRLPSWDEPRTGRTSRLFLSGFFNSIVKQIRPVSEFLKDQGFKALVCDDSEQGDSIMPLKLAAIRAGLGWQGKNTLLINRKFGSFLALGGILTNAEFNYKSRIETDKCKDCDKCQNACPVNALGNNYILDKDRCLSFRLQTDNFPKEFEASTGNRVMDCEICQDVCPWNHKHIKSPLNTGLTESFKTEAAGWEKFFELDNLLNLSEGEYKNKIGSLESEVPFSIFSRNVMMAKNNLRDHGREIDFHIH